MDDYEIMLLEKLTEITSEIKGKTLEDKLKELNTHYLAN